MNKTFIWWKFLCVIAVVNIAVWLWAVAIRPEMGEFSYAQPILSGCYVLVCAFRSFFPRIDLERYCLIDSPLSSIALGRSLATLAEICFSIQCALLINGLGSYLDSVIMIAISWSLVPIIVLAQFCCWRAALTLNHFWHGMEEMLWVVMSALSAACFIAGMLLLDGWLRVLMGVGIISCLGAAYVMMFVDIPMYFDRCRDRSGSQYRYLEIAEGLKDVASRRIQTSDWGVWKQEVLWISAYFTFGVWLSIGMIFIRF